MLVFVRAGRATVDVLRVVAGLDLGRVERKLLFLAVDDLALQRQRKLCDAGNGHHIGVHEREACQCDLVDLVPTHASTDAQGLARSLARACGQVLPAGTRGRACIRDLRHVDGELGVLVQQRDGRAVLAHVGDKDGPSPVGAQRAPRDGHGVDLLAGLRGEQDPLGNGLDDLVGVVADVVDVALACHDGAPFV